MQFCLSAGRTHRQKSSINPQLTAKVPHVHLELLSALELGSCSPALSGALAQLYVGVITR